MKIQTVSVPGRALLMTDAELEDLRESLERLVRMCCTYDESACHACRPARALLAAVRE